MTDTRTRICKCDEDLPDEYAPLTESHDHGCGIYHKGAVCSMKAPVKPKEEEG